jgi:hypothetical protein
MRFPQWTVMLFLACGDGVGTSGECAFGGALTDCDDAELTPEGACWRLVECGALPIEGTDEFTPDWGNCVDGIADLTPDRERLVLRCVAAATCDELRVDDLCQVFGR